MVGFAISPLFLGPLSETVGRRPVLVGSLTLYAILTLCCALSPTYDILLVFRALAGTTASVANAVVPGLFADTFESSAKRGLAMSYFMLASAMGPLTGPLISGYISLNLGWRWVFWIALIIVGVCLPVIWPLPETDVPILEDKLSPPTISEDEKQLSLRERLPAIVEFLARPVRMMCVEPILSLSSLYLALVYALMYLVFQAYPIVFGVVYGMSQDQVGLAYIPCKHILPLFRLSDDVLMNIVLIGSIMAFVIFQLYSSYHARAVWQRRAWALIEEYRRLPLACLGGPW